jgi:hypothetical protein
MFRIFVLRTVTALALSASVLCTTAQAAPTMQHLRGTVVKASATSVTIATGDGNTTVAIAPKSVILGVVPASLSDVKPNTFVGISNFGPSSDARAFGVFILPEALHSGFQGSAPWDLATAGATDSHMTNGTLSQSSHMTNGMLSASSHMTNGTVSQSSSSGAVRLTLTYNGGSTTAVVSSNTPVVRATLTTWKTLVPGAHLFASVVPSNNGGTAALIVVGEHGLEPPM